jgi:hypothetical protein
MAEASNLQSIETTIKSIECFFDRFNQTLIDLEKFITTDSMQLTATVKETSKSSISQLQTALNSRRALLIERLNKKLKINLTSVNRNHLTILSFKRNNFIKSPINSLLGKLTRSKMSLNLIKYFDFYNPSFDVDLKDFLTLAAKQKSTRRADTTVNEFLVPISYDILVFGYSLKPNYFYLSIIDRIHEQVVSSLNIITRDNFEATHLEVDHNSILLFFYNVHEKDAKILIEIYDLNLELKCSKLLETNSMRFLHGMFVMMTNVHLNKQHIMIFFDIEYPYIQFYDWRFNESHQHDLSIINSKFLTFEDANDQHLVLKSANNAYLVGIDDLAEMRNISHSHFKEDGIKVAKISKDSKYLIATTSVIFLLYDIQSSVWLFGYELRKISTSYSFSNLEINYLDDCDMWAFNKKYAKRIKYI